MMTDSLIAWLLAQPPIQSLVGTRIYPSLGQRDDTTPYLVVQQTSGKSPLAMDGPAGYAVDHYTISCWGATVAEATTAAGAVAGAIGGYRGVMGSVYVQKADVIDQRDALYASPDVETLREFEKQIDVEIWWN